MVFVLIKGMRKYLIIVSITISLLAAALVYCLFFAPPEIAGMARSALAAVGLSGGPESKTAASDAGKPRETVANLPDGYYIYIGNRPTQGAPRWVVINPGGTIAWLNETSATASVLAAKPSGATQPQPTNGRNGGNTVPASGKLDEKWQFEEYDYPTIKWTARTLADGDGAIGQLLTSYEPGRQAAATNGVLKYRLTLFKAADARPREVQLLDGRGFKLIQFVASDFHQVPESQLMEARDSVPCEEEDYRQARDYSIK